MKRLIGERRHASGVHPDGPVFKERRRAYYHGKYGKRMFFLLMLIISIALVVITQVS